jgi:hypothetical protein
MYACLFLIFTLMIRVVSSRDMVLHGNIFYAACRTDWMESKGNSLNLGRSCK